MPPATSTQNCTMFKKTYALMFALFCASTPSASCVGTARAGLLKSSLRAARVTRWDTGRRRPW